MNDNISNLMLDEARKLLEAIESGEIRSLIFLAIEAKEGIATDVVRCFAIPKDRLPMASLLSRLVAGLIGTVSIGEEQYIPTSGNT